MWVRAASVGLSLPTPPGKPRSWRTEPPERLAERPPDPAGGTARFGRR